MTIGMTTFNVATVIDTAVRRIGIHASKQTPEILEIAKNNLFLVLNNMPNVGINLWCIEEVYIPLEYGKSKYTMDVGTIDVLDTSYRRLTRISDYTVSTTPTDYVVEFTEASDVLMMYLDCVEDSVELSFSNDGITYGDAETVDTTDAKWHMVEKARGVSFVKISNSTSITVNSVELVSYLYDIPMYRTNRNDYSLLPNKHQVGTPNMFLFDRKIAPEMILWPVPNNSSDGNLIRTYRSRHISDIDGLNSDVEVPLRWLDAVVWNLAKNIAYEIEGVPADRIVLCSERAAESLQNVQIEERDSSEISIIPNISVYTS